MFNKKSKVLIIISVLIGVLIGIAVSNYKNIYKFRAIIAKQFTVKTNYWDGFSVVEIPSSYDKTIQKAYFYRSGHMDKTPLIVSLHSWSSDYTEKDELAILSRNEDWNYIHPDFRGANDKLIAMMSDAVMQDIDDSLEYAINNANVDLNNIVIIGSSGGGLAVLGAYLRSSYKLKLCMAWNPISDLKTWYNQSKYSNTKYWHDIHRATGSIDTLNAADAFTRSPIHYSFPTHPSDTYLELYAGINDGYNGSVSLIHAISFYNKIVENLGTENPGIIYAEDIILLLSRSIIFNYNNGYIGNREVIFKKNHHNNSIVVFNGGHEMLTDYAFSRIKEICLK